ncbi:MAG: Npt1/Npt2 family nucleotide transporter [Myxococcales bacterium]|nr:Npt1/Npt2 family nucleotide transporter [Myxococcales bacterium]
MGAEAGWLRLRQRQQASRMSTSGSASPLRAVLDVHREELPLTLLMAAYFFFVITSFWILKPIKKALFIEYYDDSGFTLLSRTLSASEAELLAKILNMVVAAVAVAAFTWLARRFRRQRLAYVFCAFFLAGYLAYIPLLARPGGATVWSFYLFGDLFSTLMVATFFAYLNDSVTPAAACRLYGIVVFGGVAGGVFGSTSVRALITALDNTHWLLVCIGLLAAIAAVAGAAARFVPEPAATPEPAAAAANGASVALEGARLVWRSPYLLALAAIVGCYEIVSTIMDFQFTATVSHYLGGRAIGAHFATVYAITNAVSMFVQLVLTSLVMTRFGVGTALLALPVLAGAGSLGFAALPALWMGSALNTIDNAFSYSINQSAREALYTPTTVDEKYKAKAFIDMFLQRFAKAVAVGVSLLISACVRDLSGLRWLSLVTVAVILLWGLAARRAGREFDRRSARQ